MKREEPTNLLLFSLCATIFIHLQLKPREKAILKSDTTTKRPTKFEPKYLRDVINYCLSHLSSLNYI